MDGGHKSIILFFLSRNRKGLHMDSLSHNSNKKIIIAKGITEVKVPEIPPCDICGAPALYDTKTKFSKWAYLCKTHYDEIGIGVLGTGFGQKLVLDDRK